MFNLFFSFANTLYICKKFFSELQTKIYIYERLNFQKSFEMVTRHAVFLRLCFVCLVSFFCSLFIHPNFPLIMALTEEQKRNLLEEACQAIEKIKSEVGKDTIKCLELPPIVNIKTGEYIGFAVIFQLSGRYQYTENTLNVWKHKLKADDYSVTVCNNRLFVTYKVRFKEI